MVKQQWPSDEKDLPLYLSPDELAALRGVSTKSLERERRAEAGPDFVKIGKKILYPRDAFLRWLESLTVSSLAEARERQSNGGGPGADCASTIG